jgi:AraC-like DNA-binding protein
MGFCDQSYFGAVFHRLAGVTPAVYRRRHHSRLRTAAGTHSEVPDPTGLSDRSNLRSL